MELISFIVLKLCTLRQSRYFSNFFYHDWKGNFQFWWFHLTPYIQDFLHSKVFITFNPFMPTGAFNICCPRDCALGIMGAPRVPPLNPSETIVFCVEASPARCAGEGRRSQIKSRTRDKASVGPAEYEFVNQFRKGRRFLLLFCYYYFSGIIFIIILFSSLATVHRFSEFSLIKPSFDWPYSEKVFCVMSLTHAWKLITNFAESYQISIGEILCFDIILLIYIKYLLIYIEEITWYNSSFHFNRRHMFRPTGKVQQDNNMH